MVYTDLSGCQVSIIFSTIINLLTLKLLSMITVAGNNDYTLRQFSANHRQCNQLRQSNLGLAQAQVYYASLDDIIDSKYDNY